MIRIMEEKIMLILFIKIVAFILLTWICYFNIDIKMSNKFLNENCGFDRKSDTRNYRLLAKYKQDRNSSNLVLKDITTNNGECKSINLSNNRKWDKRKKEQFNRSLLNKSQYYTEIIDYDNGMFDGKHFHFQKKWIRKKDYDHFFEKKRRIGNIALNKIKFKNYRFGVAILFIFFLLGIGLPILRGFHLSSLSTPAQGNGGDIDTVILGFLKNTLGLQNEAHAYIILYAVTLLC
ncbi:fam-m protein [Plasmodium malariae]|uniref:Fam-m protein n=1 Tax=Plasmodium malariae TaxID=5858 RepID=A0A1D3P9U1_PLAMA|nr:fam-m protein [Plasmodium malariae]SCN11978.1 fam-m protein [Plasmodium malariae]